MLNLQRRRSRDRSGGLCPLGSHTVWVLVLFSLAACSTNERSVSPRGAEDAGPPLDTAPAAATADANSLPAHRLDLGGQDLISGEEFRFPEELDVALGLFDAVELKTRILAPRGFSLSFNQGPSLVTNEPYPMKSAMDPLYGKVWIGSDEGGMVAASARPVDEGAVRFEVLEWETGGRVEGIIEGGRFTWQNESHEVDLSFSGRFEITLPEL